MDDSVWLEGHPQLHKRDFYCGLPVLSLIHDPICHPLIMTSSSSCCWQAIVCMLVHRLFPSSRGCGGSAGTDEDGGRAEPQQWHGYAAAAQGGCAGWNMV